jgi:D-alanyl-lipoteichoic acid acyltransferase DltB (MBOAT superfamily)
MYNCTVTDFWRSWHRSLYLFIVRYIYVPLGGSRNRLYSVWLIFGFIAVWHDLWILWLAWALANCLLTVCEAFVVNIIGNSPLVRRIKIASNNTYGFEGSKIFLQQLFWREGSIWFILFMIITVS